MKFIFRLLLLNAAVTDDCEVIGIQRLSGQSAKAAFKHGASRGR